MAKSNKPRKIHRREKFYARLSNKQFMAKMVFILERYKRDKAALRAELMRRIMEDPEGFADSILNDAK